MTNIISPQAFVKSIVALHENCTITWHARPPAIEEAEAVFRLVESNHLNNFLLWHEEDKARRDDQGFEYVYRAKRNIDGYNQARNNDMQLIDEWLFQHYQPSQSEDCLCNSETPGMIVDRLSILALKAYHMREQTERQDVAEDHIETCLEKLSVIERQLAQLECCLAEFIQAIFDKKRTYRVYHQFKMYNDAALNPELYSSVDS